LYLLHFIPSAKTGKEPEDKPVIGMVLCLLLLLAVMLKVMMR